MAENNKAENEHTSQLNRVQRLVTAPHLTLKQRWAMTITSLIAGMALLLGGIIVIYDAYITTHPPVPVLEDKQALQKSPLGQQLQRSASNEVSCVVVQATQQRRTFLGHTYTAHLEWINTSNNRVTSLSLYDRLHHLPRTITTRALATPAQTQWYDSTGHQIRTPRLRHLTHVSVINCPRGQQLLHSHH